MMKTKKKTGGWGRITSATGQETGKAPIRHGNNPGKVMTFDLNKANQKKTHKNKT